MELFHPPSVAFFLTLVREGVRQQTQGLARSPALQAQRLKP